MDGLEDLAGRQRVSHHGDLLQPAPESLRQRVVAPAAEREDHGIRANGIPPVVRLHDHPVRADLDGPRSGPDLDAPALDLLQDRPARAPADVLADLGGAELVGRATELVPGTFWEPLVY